MRTQQHQGAASSFLQHRSSGLQTLPPRNHPAPATQSHRRLQVPKNPGADARTPQGELPGALLGGVVPRLGATRKAVAAVCAPVPHSAQLTSRMAEQKRLCRTRWRACSFCGGSSPLRWSRSRSSTARDTSAGRRRARARRYRDTKMQRSTERCGQRPS